MRVRKVLIVENNHLYQKVLKNLLSHYPCKINVVSSATEAFDDIIQKADCWKTNGYDLIFIDVYLQDIDGYSLTDILEKIMKPMWEKTYVVAITADKRFRERADICFDPKEIDEVIIKPVTLEKVDMIWKNFLKTNN